MSSIDQQFVEYIVKSLVGNPDAVLIERRIDEKGVLLELTVDPEDLGRVIGKRGATAQSLRTLLRALGTKNDARYNLKIIDNGDGGGHNNSGGESRGGSDGSSSNDSYGGGWNAGSKNDESVPRGSSKSIKSSEPTEVADSGYTDKKLADHEDAMTKTRKELEDLDDFEV